MRKEVYEMLIEQLSKLYATPEGDYGVAQTEDDVPEGWERAIKHIDLWNHNVEFIEQEENWERPAVFVEFQPIQWNAIKPGFKYRAVALVNLHVGADWQGDSSVDSVIRVNGRARCCRQEGIHLMLACRRGKTFLEFDLMGSSTNHNHEEIIENIETYQCVAIKSL